MRSHRDRLIVLRSLGANSANSRRLEKKFRPIHKKITYTIQWAVKTFEFHAEIGDMLLTWILFVLVIIMYPCRISVENRPTYYETTETIPQ
jgi:hypothetical protein